MHVGSFVHVFSFECSTHCYVQYGSSGKSVLASEMNVSEYCTYSYVVWVPSLCLGLPGIFVESEGDGPFD